MATVLAEEELHLLAGDHVTMFVDELKFYAVPTLFSFFQVDLHLVTLSNFTPLLPRPTPFKTMVFL